MEAIPTNTSSYILYFSTLEIIYVLEGSHTTGFWNNKKHKCFSSECGKNLGTLLSLF